jgi:putative aminopeptidase FrvX
MELKELSSLASVSGNEYEVRDAICKELRAMGVWYELDVLGNILAKKGKTGPKVMVDAHMDEVGLMIVHIEKNGFLRFVSVGVPAAVLASKRVLIGKNKVPGVIGTKAIHLQQPKERQSITPIDQLFIDIGAKSKEDAESKVHIGDYAVFDTKFEELSEDVVKGKAFDDRVGCAILLEALKDPWENVQLCASFSVQEEVGLRGAKVAAYTFEPDMAIALEGTVCADIPGEKDFYATKMGEGAVLSFMDRTTISSRVMVDHLLNLAREKAIPVQFRESTSGGNNAGAMHQARAGCPVATISVPCRYIHSPVSLLSKKDMEAAKSLLIEFLRSVEGGFRP